ncbi:hypothetical protein [Legionella hackeliae]|uniref:Uncharacterized protein n=1 Tax=Legionella hackeliae TaxID=449 RepID=A0A0A8UV14_LEGHA|nr:hypothetical protein [Legionella hackeliae]KTD09731.1 hypothetical protein Lhac_2099 [Legionella hackeliae]CEK10942.1 protein of unknown function [Legionella hackeliae]STX47682.1 Uncharacterised protein [Legionella hackeliae]
MKDPLEALEESLAYMFELQTTKKTGNYIHPSVQKLKEALENYKNGPSLSLRELTAAIKLALPVIENYVDGYMVKLKMDALAQVNGSSIIWDAPGPKSRGYPYFQFHTSLAQSRNDFISWISLRCGLEFNTLEPSQQVAVMLTEISKNEFMTKLAEHLLKNPYFLCNLTLASPEIFIEIITTRLGFELENHHIAKAIVYHCDSMIDSSGSSSEEINNYFDELNMHLAVTTRSIDKLLDDSQAKEELEKKDIFQYYNENKTRDYAGQP